MSWTVIADGKRPCTTCSEVKPLSEFGRHQYTTKQGKRLMRYASRCNVCEYHRGSARPRKTDRTWTVFRRMPDIAVKPGHNICRKCMAERPLSEFYKNKRSANGYSYHCKVCHTKGVRFYQGKHKGRTKVWWRRSMLKRKYGITPELYDEILATQNGKCKLCDKLMKRVCIDHCHKSGLFRGLLCQPCNVALGIVDDSPELLRKMILYLGGVP